MPCSNSFKIVFSATIPTIKELKNAARIDDNVKINKLKGLKVYNKEAFVKLKKNYKLTIVIAIPSLDNYKRQLIINYFINYKYRILTTPDLWDIKSGFPIVGQCFLFCLFASTPLLILSAFGWGHLITNLLIYLITFVSLMAILKPFNNDQRQLLTTVYPELGNRTKWFFRS